MTLRETAASIGETGGSARMGYVVVLPPEIGIGTYAGLVGVGIWSTNGSNLEPEAGSRRLVVA